MNYPMVSIIIPLFNYQDFVLDTIESCLYQKYQGEFEVIVVDDASTDSSVFKIGHFFHKHKLLKLIQFFENKGYSAAKNEGIRKSRGDLIVTIDADDMLTEDSIAVRAEELIKNENLLMVHALAWTIKGEGGLDYWVKRLYKLEYESKRKKIHAQTVMLRRSVHRDYGLYDEKLRSRSDNEMWRRLIDVAKIGDRIKFIEYPVAFYRKHNRSMVEFRKHCPPYNQEQTKILEAQKEMRLREGITRENTIFLKR